jgi:hypothetical protein
MTPGDGSGAPATRYMVTVFLTTGEEMQPFGRTRDLSISGAFVETAERPEIGSLREIAIVWGDDTVVCTAKIMRHAADGIGVTFINPSDSFQQAVAEILQTAPPRRSTLEL